MGSLRDEYPMGFGSLADYECFRQLVEDDPDFESIPVGTHRSNVGFVERWFRDKNSNNVYRLVEPDAPSRGGWEVVRDDKLNQNDRASPATHYSAWTLRAYLEDIRAEYPWGFKSASDYKYFCRLIEQDAGFESVPVRTPQSNVGFVERWFRDKQTAKVYRLVKPDGPFRGSWEVVPEDELE